MKSSFTGMVLNGSLQLDDRIDLADQSRVQVTVVPLTNWRERWHQALTALDELRKSRPINSGGVHFTRDELHERR